MINWGRNASNVPGEGGGLLCENLLSSTTAAIFFSQLVTISLIANAAEYYHQALVQGCQLLGAHNPLPAVNHFAEKSISCLIYWIQVLTAGWHVSGTGRVLRLPIRVFRHPNIQNQHAPSPTAREGEGWKQLQCGWCMMWTPVSDLGFNQEKGRKWKRGRRVLVEWCWCGP